MQNNFLQKIIEDITLNDFIKKFKKNWGMFFYLLFDPITLFLLGCIALLIYYQNIDPKSNYLIFFSILISIIAGLLGSVLLSRWSKYNEEQLIKARGYGAIRNLSLLLQVIKKIQLRINDYLENLNKNSENIELTKNSFHEVFHECTILNEIGISSIESWRDLIPEANIKSQIGTITSLEKEISKLKSDKRSLETDLEKLKVKSNENSEDKNTIENLKKEIKDRNNKIEVLTEKLNSSISRINESGITGVSGSVSIGTGTDLSHWGVNLPSLLSSNDNFHWTTNMNIYDKSNCQKCGKPFNRNINSSSKICPDCYHSESE